MSEITGEGNYGTFKGAQHVSVMKENGLQLTSRGIIIAAFPTDLRINYSEWSSIHVLLPLLTILLVCQETIYFCPFLCKGSGNAGKHSSCAAG